MLDVRSAPGIPKAGDLVAGKYRVERVIGAGGMGCVLVADHVLLRTRVAIKVLLPQAAALPGATERFLREAQAAAALRGEHVARVLDVGLTETGAPFLVMEYLSGQDLRTVIRERAPLRVDEAVGYVLQACEAIVEAHAMGILHRDLKPANLFVTSRPNGRPLVKVLDFGLAKVLAPGDRSAPEESITETGQVIGSPHYMPPEQFRSLRNADVRSDIWALGVVLYEMLTGKRPFSGEGMTGVMASVIADNPAPANSLRPDLPPGLNALIMCCLEKPPELRPQRVADVIAALEPFAPRPALPSSAWLEVPGTASEPVTIPLQSRRPSPEAHPQPLAPAPVAQFAATAPATSVPVMESGRPSAAPATVEPVMPPLPGRSTLRIVPVARSSAADDVTGVLPSNESPAVAVRSAPLGGPEPTITQAHAAEDGVLQVHHAGDQGAMRGSVPSIQPSFAPRNAVKPAAPSPADDITDLSQADSTLQRQPGRERARSLRLTFGAVLVLMLAGGVGIRMLLSDSSDDGAGEPAISPGMSATTPTQPLLEPTTTLHAEPVPAAASAVPQASAPEPSAASVSLEEPSMPASTVSGSAGRPGRARSPAPAGSAPTTARLATSVLPTSAPQPSAVKPAVSAEPPATNTSASAAGASPFKTYDAQKKKPE